MAPQRDEARFLHAQGMPMTELVKNHGVTWERVKGWLVKGYAEYQRRQYWRNRRKTG